MDAAWLAALGTWAAVLVTVVLVVNQISLARRTTQVELQAMLHNAFWCPTMIEVRKALARELLLPSPQRDSIQEHVLNHFEEMGVLLRRGFIDRELTWTAAGYYGPRWWEATKEYVRDERARQNGRKTLFEEFEWLSQELLRMDAKRRSLRLKEVVPSGGDVRAFLHDEAVLS